jgi:alpha-mannosidase
VRGFRGVCGSFSLMTPEETAAFSGNEQEAADAVRVVEDGEIRSVVEAVMKYGLSTLVLRYELPKHGTEIGVRLRVCWAEKMKMLKLSLPTPYRDGRYLGQIMYGRDELPADGSEAVAQRYTAVVSGSGREALTIINSGTYGSDFRDGEARMTLLRSPGYAAGCSDFSRRKPLVMEQDRCNEFMDQGIREFRFWLNAGPAADRLDRVETEALAHHEEPDGALLLPVGRRAGGRARAAGRAGQRRRAAHGVQEARGGGRLPHPSVRAHRHGPEMRGFGPGRRRVGRGGAGAL